MTVNIVAFEPGHLARFVPQQAQLEDLAHCQAWAEWSVLEGDKTVGIGGLQEIWRGRAYAYALLAADAGPHLVAMTRAIRFHLAAASFARIELVVAAGFEPGRRWAELLGFELETPSPLRQFLPSGRDAWLYARIQDGVRADDSAGDAVRRRAVRQRGQR